MTIHIKVVRVNRVKPFSRNVRKLHSRSRIGFSPLLRDIQRQKLFAEVSNPFHINVPVSSSSYIRPTREVVRVHRILEQMPFLSNESEDRITKRVLGIFEEDPSLLLRFSTSELISKILTNPLSLAYLSLIDDDDDFRRKWAEYQHDLFPEDDEVEGEY